MSNTIKKYGVFSAVGNQSLHHNWISSMYDFDLHLIVYDHSLEKYINDTKYITEGRGYKFKLIYEYLLKNPEFLEIYDYYYIPDDDILIDSYNISKLFDYMEKYNLKIAQPALYDSYYTFSHTIRERHSILRFTNFVELMQPCFSRETLKKVLFTFNENKSGWGIDYHWGKIISSKGDEMAIIDDVKSVHSRPISSYNFENRRELNEYLKKYKLNSEIKVFDIIPKEYIDNNSSWNPVLSIEDHRKAYSCLERITQLLICNFKNIETPGLYEGTLGISLFFFEYHRISGKQKYFDLANYLLEKTIVNLSAIKEDYSLSSGIVGIAWGIEYLAQHNFIENNTDEVLDEIISLTNSKKINNFHDISIKNGLLGYGLQLIIRIKNQLFNRNAPQRVKEINQLVNILNLIEKFEDSNLSFETIVDILIFLNQLLNTNIQKEITDRVVSLYVNKLLQILEAENYDYLKSHTKYYLWSIVILYNIAINKKNDIWKNTAITSALNSINNGDFDIINKDIFPNIELVLLYNYLYMQTQDEKIRLFSVKTFSKSIEILIKNKAQSSTDSNHDKQEFKSSLALTGLMIISFLSENFSEWNQSCLNEKTPLKP